MIEKWLHITSGKKLWNYRRSYRRVFSVFLTPKAILLMCQVLLLFFFPFIIYNIAEYCCTAEWSWDRNYIVDPLCIENAGTLTVQFPAFLPRCHHSYRPIPSHIIAFTFTLDRYTLIISHYWIVFIQVEDYDASASDDSSIDFRYRILLNVLVARDMFRRSSCMQQTHDIHPQ